MIKGTIKDNIYVVQSVVLFISMVVGVTLYFHNAFATNAKVDQIKEKIEKKQEKTEQKVIVVQSILCKMAIEQNLSSAVEICTRESNKTN